LRKSLMRCAPVILLNCLLATAGGLAAGCGQQQTFSDQEKADIRDSWKPGSSPAVQHPQSALLAEGPAPLLYQAQESGPIRVTDSASGVVLATATVGRGTMIRIDPDNGIFVAEKRLRAGPLKVGQRFSITLEMNQPNEWQSRVEAPKPAPPTTPGDPPAGEAPI
jgi:hypothetical protein